MVTLIWLLDSRIIKVALSHGTHVLILVSINAHLLEALTSLMQPTHPLTNPLDNLIQAHIFSVISPAHHKHQFVPDYFYFGLV